MRRKLTILLPCLVLVMLVAGHTVAWFAASRYLESGFNDWAAHRRAAGWQVEAGTPMRGGWPLAATLTVPDLALSAGAPNALGRVSLHAERVVLSLAATSPDRLGIDLNGAQSVQVAPGPDVPFTADRLHVEVPLGRSTAAPAAGLEVRTLRAAGLTIGLLTGQVATPASPTLSLSAEAIDLPPDIPWAFGPHISSFAVDAAVRGGLPPPGALPAMAEAWRDAGGALDITHLALGWGPLGVAATAHLGFDAALQPVGTTDLRVIGYDKALTALAKQRMITKDAATAATAVLTLLSRPPTNGGAPEVDVPLTLHDRTLSMGQTPLLRVPELVWPKQ
jgi:Uncharacterized protein conserved in bacteria (DUF2125)